MTFRELTQGGFGILMFQKGWLAIAKLKPLSLFISLLLIPNKAFDNVKKTALFLMDGFPNHDTKKDK